MSGVHNLARSVAVALFITTAVLILILAGEGAKDLVFQRWSNLQPDIPVAIMKRHVEDLSPRDDHVVTMEFLWTPPTMPTMVSKTAPLSQEKAVIEASVVDTVFITSETKQFEPVTIYMTTTIYEPSSTTDLHGNQGVDQDMAKVIATPVLLVTSAQSATFTPMKATTASQINTSSNAFSFQVPVYAADLVTEATPSIAKPVVVAVNHQVNVLADEKDETCDGGCSFPSPALSAQSGQFSSSSLPLQPTLPTSPQIGAIASPACSPYLVATFFGQCPFGGSACAPETTVTATCTTTVTSYTACESLTVTSYLAASTVTQTLLVAGSCPNSAAGSGSAAGESGGHIAAEPTTLLSLTNSLSLGLSSPAVPALQPTQSLTVSSSLSVLSNAGGLSTLGISSSDSVLSSSQPTEASSRPIASIDQSSGNIGAPSSPVAISLSGSSSGILLISNSESINTPVLSPSSSVVLSQSSALVSPSSLIPIIGSFSPSAAPKTSDSLAVTPLATSQIPFTTTSQPLTVSATPVLSTIYPSSSAAATLVNPVPLISQLTTAPVLSPVTLPSSALNSVASLASDLLGDASSLIGGNALSSILTEVNSIVGNLPVVGSVVAPIVSDIESLLPIAAQITSIAGGIVDPVLGGVGQGAGSIVAPLLSDVASIVGDVTSLAGGLVDPITGSGGLLSPVLTPVAPVLSEVLGNNGLGGILSQVLNPLGLGGLFVEVSVTSDTIARKTSTPAMVTSVDDAVEVIITRIFTSTFRG